MSKMNNRLSMSVSEFREKVFTIARTPSKFHALVITKDGKPAFMLMKAPEASKPKKAAPKKK